MKKILSFALVAFSLMGLSSCGSVYHTSKNVPIDTSIVSASTADLQVSQQKISFTYKPTASVRKAGDKRVFETAVAEALKANGNADVLVGFQYEIKRVNRTIKYITVEGYPAKYVNVAPVKP